MAPHYEEYPGLREAWIEFLGGPNAPESLHPMLTYPRSGVLNPIAWKLVEPVQCLTRADHPSRTLALQLIAEVLGCFGGPLAAQEARAQRGPTKNPFTGRLEQGRSPDLHALTEEKAALEALHRDLEVDLPMWLELAASADQDLAGTAAWALSRARHHPDRQHGYDIARGVHARLQIVWLKDEIGWGLDGTEPDPPT